MKIRIYTAVILPAVIYELETWFLGLREERILRVFEILVPKRIFKSYRGSSRRTGKNTERGTS
jgi:hypothetical protein